MTLKINIQDLDIQITAQALSQEAFASFGDVISNPRPSVHPAVFGSHAGSLPPNAVSANQGSAIQYRNVSRLKNLYGQAPSGSAEPIMSVFVCAARDTLTPAGDADSSASASASASEFTVRHLERHPFTTQTFTPIRSTAAAYLVIVAPSLPPSSADEHLPVPTGDHGDLGDLGGDGLPGRGLPDLGGLRAFVATSGQAVTYGAGTWHSPMVALGQPGTALDFVVSQFASGVALEDCQLVEFVSDGSEEPRVRVRIPRADRAGKL